MTAARLIAAVLSGFAGGFFGLTMWQSGVLCLIWVTAIAAGERAENRKRREAITTLLEQSRRSS